MKNLRKRIISLVLTMAVCMTTFYITPARNAGAATVYITVESFAKSLAGELGLKSITGSTGNGYVDALIDKGIIKIDDFTSYKKNLTRGDAMVLLNRADEYLYGDKLDTALVQLAIDKRISDITSVNESKKTYVAKAYLKGFVKGYSNGNYSTDRNMKVKCMITSSGALGCIKMLKNKSLRAKISPDGQLIRTTSLPKNASMYPYILASYPNSYYDWYFPFDGEGCKSYTIYNPDTQKVEEHQLEYLKDYAYPADVDKTTEIDNLPQVKKDKLDTWVDKVQTHMQSIFNVDYRTIGQDWIDKVASVDYTYGYWKMEDQTKERLKNYVDGVKKEKTIIECSKVAVDGSSLYYYDNLFYLRVYVKYRIVSTESTYKGGSFYEKNSLIYTSSPLHLNDVTPEKWKEHCFDVALAWYDKDEKDNLGVVEAEVMEYLNDIKY